MFWKLLFISDFEHSFHTRICFDCFGSCGSPNRAYDGFLEIPIYLVCFSKILANESLYFGSYRSWSGGYSQAVQTRATNLVIFVRGFPIVKWGDSFSYNPLTDLRLYLNFVLDFMMSFFRVLNPKMFSVWICLWNRGLYFWSLYFGPVHLVKIRFRIWNFYRD